MLAAGVMAVIIIIILTTIIIIIIALRIGNAVFGSKVTHVHVESTCVSCR